MNRIPKLTGNTITNVIEWIKALDNVNCTFHFDDAPEDIINSATGEKVFSKSECKRINKILPHIFYICEVAERDPFEISSTYSNVKDMFADGLTSKCKRFTVTVDKVNSTTYQWTAYEHCKLIASGLNHTSYDGAVYQAKESVQYWVYAND